MRVLIIHNKYLNPGGEDAVVRSEVKMLESFGHNVFLYERHNNEMINVGIFKQIRFLFKEMVYSIRTYQDLTRIIQEFKPDIAHIHNIFYMLSLSVFDVLRKYKIPIVQTLHNYRYLCPAGTFFRNQHICEECLTSSRIKSIAYGCWQQSRLKTWFLNRLLDKLWSNNGINHQVDAFIALSDFSKNKFIAGGINSDLLRVKSNFIDIDPGANGIKDQFFLYAGTMQDYKGVDVLLKAWQTLPQEQQLIIVGDGPLLTRMKDLNKHPNVSFLGQQSMQKVIELMRCAKAVILPSLCYENFPRIIVEAYACATPVIASNIGAMKELVNDRHTGLLFTAGNADQLRKCIEDISFNSDLAVQLGKQARQTYETKYTLQRNHEQLMHIYQSILKS